jgi:hypothetical protein
MLLEGVRQWPGIAQRQIMPSGISIDVSEMCVMLQQLLYANAPADVTTGVLKHAGMYSLLEVQERAAKKGAYYASMIVDEAVDSRIWFYPPALMATEKVQGLNRENVKHSSLPDLLSAAVNMNANNSKLPIVKAVRGSARCPLITVLALCCTSSSLLGPFPCVSSARFRSALCALDTAHIASAATVLPIHFLCADCASNAARCNAYFSEPALICANCAASRQTSACIPFADHALHLIS